jgi:hypothetical protein
MGDRLIDQFFPMIHTDGSDEPQFGCVCSRKYIDNSFCYIGSIGSLRIFILSFLQFMSGDWTSEEDGS